MRVHIIHNVLCVVCCVLCVVADNDELKFPSMLLGLPCVPYITHFVVCILIHDFPKHTYTYSTRPTVYITL